MTVDYEPRPLTAIVCDYDPMWLETAKARVKRAGFEVVEDPTNIPDALRWSEYLKPSLVVVTNEHDGLSAKFAVKDFRAQAHKPELLVLSTTDQDRSMFIADGAFDLIKRFDDVTFDAKLVEIKEFLVTGERRKEDRRERVERRKEQTWRGVSSERRRGGDRRNQSRREEGVVREPKKEAPAEAAAASDAAKPAAAAASTAPAKPEAPAAAAVDAQDIVARAVQKANRVAARPSPNSGALKPPPKKSAAEQAPAPPKKVIKPNFMD